MNALDRYIALVKCKHEYISKMPQDVESVKLVSTGRTDYPEVLEICWKSGGKSAIGNERMVKLAKGATDDINGFSDLAKTEIDNQISECKNDARKIAYDTRNWTYILCVLDKSGNREERYSWNESNSWELYGNSDEELFKSIVRDCLDFRSQSTSRWHVYKRIRGEKEMNMVF